LRYELAPGAGWLPMAIELLVTASGAADIVGGVLAKYDATEWGAVGNIKLYQFPMNAGGVGLKYIDRRQARLYIWQVIKPDTTIFDAGTVGDYAGHLCWALSNVVQVGYIVEHEVRTGVEKCRLCEVNSWDREKWRELWEYEKYPDGWLLEKTPDGEYVASTRHREAFRSALMTVPGWAIIPGVRGVEAQIVETTARLTATPKNTRKGGRPPNAEKYPELYKAFTDLIPRYKQGEKTRGEIIAELTQLAKEYNYAYAFNVDTINNWLRPFAKKRQSQDKGNLSGQ
jgi:hypothetical protein